MGVKLKDLVEKKDIRWESLNNKKLAVDAPNVIFQFLSSIRQADGTALMDSEGNITSHLVGLFSRVPNLMQKGITPIFVFDGKAPKLKEQTRKKRREIKEIAQEKFARAVIEEDVESMGKYSKQLSVFNKEMVQESKDLLEALGLQVVQAPSEAEAQCAHMCKKKQVWATASQDYDTLLFGSPKLLQNLTLSEKRKVRGGRYIKINPTLIELKDVFETLELNQDELIILGVLVGTDFNPKGVKGIGPKKALKLIQTGKKFEKIFEELETDFDWEEIYKIFKEMPVEDVKLEEKELDEEKIKEILVEKHEFKEERVNNTIKKLTEKKDSSLKKWF